MIAGLKRRARKHDRALLAEYFGSQLFTDLNRRASQNDRIGVAALARIVARGGPRARGQFQPGNRLFLVVEGTQDDIVCDLQKVCEVGLTVVQGLKSVGCSAANRGRVSEFILPIATSWRRPAGLPTPSADSTFG